MLRLAEYLGRMRPIFEHRPYHMRLAKMKGMPTLECLPAAIAHSLGGFKATVPEVIVTEPPGRIYL